MLSGAFSKASSFAGCCPAASRGAAKGQAEQCPSVCRGSYRLASLTSVACHGVRTAEAPMAQGPWHSTCRVLLRLTAVTAVAVPGSRAPGAGSPCSFEVSSRSLFIERVRHGSPWDRQTHVQRSLTGLPVMVRQGQRWCQKQDVFPFPFLAGARSLVKEGRDKKESDSREQM